VAEELVNVMQQADAFWSFFAISKVKNPEPIFGKKFTKCIKAGLK
jgi:hypothetical protein